MKHIMYIVIMRYLTMLLLLMADNKASEKYLSVTSMIQADVKPFMRIVAFFESLIIYE